MREYPTVYHVVHGPQGRKDFLDARDPRPGGAADTKDEVVCNHPRMRVEKKKEKEEEKQKESGWQSASSNGIAHRHIIHGRLLRRQGKTCFLLAESKNILFLSG